MTLWVVNIVSGYILGVLVDWLVCFLGIMFGAVLMYVNGPMGDKHDGAKMVRFCWRGLPYALIWPWLLVLLVRMFLRDVRELLEESDRP